MASALTLLMTNLNTTPTFENILAPNGGFNIWQRGSSVPVGASTTAYTADRWYLTTGLNQACTVASATGLTAAAPANHAANVARNSGQTGVTAITFGYPLDTDEINRLRGSKISFSGAAKAGANWSPTGGTFTINVYFGTGAVSKRGGGFTNETNPLSISVNLAAGVTNTSITGTSAAAVASNVTQGEIQITWTPTGTAGVDDSITFDQFCLVPSATVVQFSDMPFDLALIECKRHYRKSFPYGVTPAQGGGLGGALAKDAASAAQVGFYVQTEPVELRVTAGVTTYNPQGASANWQNVTSGSSVPATLDTAAPGPKGFLIIAGTVTTAGNLLYIHYTASAGI